MKKPTLLFANSKKPGEFKKLPPIELIVWEDHYSIGDGWIDINELEETGLKDPLLITSVGFVINENKKTLVLVDGVGDHGRTPGHIVLLQSAIRHRTVLRKGTK